MRSWLLTRRRQALALAQGDRQRTAGVPETTVRLVEAAGKRGGGIHILRQLSGTGPHTNGVNLSHTAAPRGSIPLTNPDMARYIQVRVQLQQQTHWREIIPNQTHAAAAVAHCGLWSEPRQRNYGSSYQLVPFPLLSSTRIGFVQNQSHLFSTRAPSRHGTVGLGVARGARGDGR